ncbi:MAG: CHAT domain-containing protein, partial [Theionarchaea archaeon]|nr:CHAT domain-containing protein [Theionarchaea archaeon]
MLTFSNLQIPPPANWQDFESLCWDLWQKIWKDPNTQKNGRQGQPQCGVDIFGRPNQKNKYAGVQCKGKDNYTSKRLTEKEVRDEVEKAKSFNPALSEYIIATTGPKDAKIEELAREITETHLESGLFSVHVFGWEDIKARLEDYPDLIKKYYPGLSVVAKTLAVQYYVSLECKNGEVVVTREYNGTTEKSSIPMEKISEIEKMCKHFNWSQSGVSQQIGKSLYTILNGKNQLKNAITKADAHGEPLQLFIRRENSVPDLPFELLYKSGFIVPSKVHVIRHVSDYGCKKKVESQNRPLKVLFMACSPENVSPVLDYEKEEETILEMTKDFPVQIDVEDTGSLQGLKDCLAHYYDVVHISGHADIDENGTPIFLMEDETGYKMPVTPLDLWDALKRNPPRLLFLSGCRTGQTPPHEAAVSFAHELVLKHSSIVLGWGLPVLDPGARMAAASLFFELSRGKSILDAVFSARQELYDKKWPDWSLLRLFSDGTPLDVPLVEEGQELKVKTRDIQYAYLQNSQVKVLEKGFIGRRRQIQKGIGSLKKDKQKVGLLIHGTGGLGKSCLAGKFCERFKDHTLVIVHGDLNAVTFLEAAKNAFIRTGDKEGQKVLQEQLEMPDKIRILCSTSFQKGKYLILLDDFEKNLEGYEQGTPVVSEETAPILGALLLCLPLAVKMSQLIITSRYTFPFAVQERGLVTERL